MKGFQPPARFGGAPISREPLPITKTITVTEGISVKDLAEKLDVRGKDLIATLLMKGVFVTVNQSLEGELVKDVARQFGADATVISVEEQLENEAIEGFLEDTTGMVEVVRSPVVTVMGHVDHGKTSLLDAIRSTDVAGGEAGGITQHIGAYKVKITKPDSPAFGREIVFLDTPGHEAFTRMRARGAKVTDIVVIVVAADDGVMPQTIEAIDHARAAKVPIIVAVNKIDKPDADPSKVIQQLTARGLQPSNLGGDTEFVEVSAKKHINLDKLEEMICLVADVNEQKAQPDRPAVGTVIEAKLDRGRGAVASILLQNGTLHLGDSYIVGNTFGKIRAMFDDRGRSITEAGPSTPVEVLGLEGMPDAGDTFLVMADRDKAKGIAQYRKMKEREAQLAKSSRVSLEGLAEQIKQAGMKDLNLILKGDVQGSVEVLADSLQRMSTEKVRVRVLHSGVGAITESDVLLASASNAVVIGFNVRPDRKAAEVAERENVEIRLHSIIYELQDEITKAMYGLLEPVFKENYAGRAEKPSTSSRSPRSARSQAAASPTASSVATSRSACSAKAKSSGRARSPPSSASRTTSAKSVRASSAESTSPATRTSRSATSSSPSPPKNSPLNSVRTPPQPEKPRKPKKNARPQQPGKPQPTKKRTAATQPPPDPHLTRSKKDREQSRLFCFAPTWSLRSQRPLHNPRSARSVAVFPRCERRAPPAMLCGSHPLFSRSLDVDRRGQMRWLT